MRARWVGCDPRNFSVGRPAGLAPEMVVLHSADGTAADATRAFFVPGAGRSAHYIVAADGAVTQHVQEADTAFHAGLIVNPSAPLVQARPRTNPNFYSIGIELEGRRSDLQMPDAQAHSLAVLAGDICARWRIPLDSTHVVTHRDIRASSDCPGPSCQVSALLERARQVQGEATFASPRTVSTVAAANLRRGPDTAAPIVSVAQRGATLAVVGLTRGREVSGNDTWYIDADGRYLWAGATSDPSPTVEDGPVSTDEMEHMPAPPRPAAPATPMFRKEFALGPHDYNVVATTKNLIVLHFTAGRSARSAYDTWRADPRRIATAYVVDVDGSIYEMFDPRYWASHLGVPAAAQERRSIGIEIANIGPLRKSADGRSLNWWANDFGSRFCSVDDHSVYRREGFRGFEFYASFPAGQVQAVSTLVRHLSERFSIPRLLPPANRRYEKDDAFFATYSGVATHANFRADKFDIGPAFDWDALA